MSGDDTVRITHHPRAVGRATGRASIRRTWENAAPLGGSGTATATAPVGADDPLRLRRQQLNHDIRHELATIMLLASLLDSASDVGVESQLRARQLLGEARWLERLQRAYDEALSERDTPEPPEPALIRLDLFAAEVVAAMGLSTTTTIRFASVETWAYADRLAFWRALRNMVGNAVRAAGPDGLVDVRIRRIGDWAVAQVDDNGPGFGALPSGTEALGLGIVHDFAITWQGHLEISRSTLGGCRVRLRTRAAAPPAPSPAVPPSAGSSAEGSDAAAHR